MGKIDHHGAVIDFPDADAAEFGQPGIFGLKAAAADGAAFIVSKLHDALTELRHDQEQAWVPFDLGVESLAPEYDAQPRLSLRPHDVGRSTDMQQPRFEFEVREVAVQAVQIRTN